MKTFMCLHVGAEVSYGAIGSSAAIIFTIEPVDCRFFCLWIS